MYISMKPEFFSGVENTKTIPFWTIIIKLGETIQFGNYRSPNNG